MQKPKLFTVIYKDSKGSNKYFETDNEETAQRKAILSNGQTWIDVRYKAKKRLYYYLLRKQMYTKKTN